MRHLLRSGFVRIKEEQKIEGRLRKIYAITSKGKEFAINSQWTILEITEFIIPFRYSLNSKDNDLPWNNFQPIKLMISELEINHISEDQLLSEIEHSPFFPCIKK